MTSLDQPGCGRERGNPAVVGGLSDPVGFCGRLGAPEHSKVQGARFGECTVHRSSRSCTKCGLWSKRGKMQNCTIERLRFAHLHQEQPDADEHPLRAEVRKATKCSMRSVMKKGRLAAVCT